MLPKQHPLANEDSVGWNALKDAHFISLVGEAATTMSYPGTILRPLATPEDVLP